MKIIDISWAISSATTGYKDKDVVQFEEIKTFLDAQKRQLTRPYN